MRGKEKTNANGLARTLFQAAWFALTNGYLRGYTSGKIYTGPSKVLCVPGLNCYSCPGAFAACPIGALQAVLNRGTYRISLYVFGFLVMFGVLFGRLVCGWMCPFGLVQDLLHKIKLGPKRKNLPGHKYLRYLRYVVLVVLVVALPALFRDVSGAGSPWFCEFLCPSGTLFGGIPLTITNVEFQQIAGWRFAWKIGILVLLCLGSVVFYRPFCKYLCPLGALYGLFNPVSTYRLEIDPGKCVSCASCQKACGMDIPTYQTPNSTDCIRCGSCMAACPTGAISSTWGVMRQKVQSRCFIDDDVPKTADKPRLSWGDATPSERLAFKLGILLIVGGLLGVFMGFISLYSDFDTRMAIDSNISLGYGSLVLASFKIVAACIATGTGIFVLRNCSDAQRVKTAREKLGIALKIYVAGIVIFVAGLFFEIQGLAMVWGLIVNIFCMLCLPFLWKLAVAVEKQIDGEQVGHRFALVMSCIMVFALFAIVAGSFIAAAVAPV